MKRLMTLAFACVCFAGCDEPAPDSLPAQANEVANADIVSQGANQTQTDDESGDGLQLEWPGGGLQLDEEGLKVRAPGVDVGVSKDTGVNVQAPGVDVGVDAEEGVRVQTPSTDVGVGGDGVNVRAPGVDVGVSGGDPR